MDALVNSTYARQTFRPVNSLHVGTRDDRQLRLVGLTILCWGIVGSSLPQMAFGQARGRELIDGMMQTLIDNEPAESRARASAARRPNDAVSPQMREVRANLAGFAQEVSSLISSLHQEVDRISGLRSLMGDALQVSARATLLSRQAGSEMNLDQIADEFEQLDEDWRLLSFRLQKLRNLSAAARESLRRADEFDTRLGELLRVNPQVNESEVVQKASILIADLKRLLEEIDQDVTDSSARYNLLIEGRRVYEQGRRMAQRASQDPRQEIVRQEYQRFRDLWSPYAAKLRPLQLRYVDRQVQRVQATDRELQELLLLPTEVDRTELLYLIESLQRDLDDLLDRITLRKLTKLPQGRDKVVNASSEFYAACADFADCVRNGESADTMAELYYYLENNWQQVAKILREAQTPEARQLYRQLDRSVMEIRDMLAVHPAHDRQEALQLAAEVDNLASAYEHDMRSAMAANPNAFPASFRSQALQAAQELRAATAKLQADIQGTDRLKAIQEQCNRVVIAWKALMTYGERFPAADRDHLDGIRRQLTPTLVDLQAMISL